jgi:bromodomain adjacent to zinc finger domain protein 1A
LSIGAVVATPLRKLQLDSYTISEVVRLHLLGSGCERAPGSARFDYQQRGGYSSIDDPALDLRRCEEELLKQLAEKNIFGLSSGIQHIANTRSI